MARSASLRESAEVNGTLDEPWLAVELGFPSQRVCWWTPEALGDEMERPNRVAQLYGYAVCLIAVVVFLASANSFVENLFTAANPLRGGADRFGIQPSVTSFEAYRATVNREARMNGPAASGAQIGSLPDSTLRARYEVLRADR